MRIFRGAANPAPIRLHIGCGQESIAGWINIDNRHLPGVDRVLDVRRGLPFQNVSAIYAEHFLEHLVFEEGLAFLRECRRVLATGGVLRLSTPNLDWVLQTHYLQRSEGNDETRSLACFDLNRAFRAWGHLFLYNREMLTAALRDAGFATVEFRRYGQSDLPFLAGLERHEKWQDTEGLPHVLVAEASGKAEPLPLPEPVREGYSEARPGILFRTKLAALRCIRRVRHAR